MVLLLALVFMLMLALVASTVSTTAALEFQMAGNDQFREEAFQQAQSIARAVAGNPGNFPLQGSPGERLCLPAAPDPLALCAGPSLSLAGGVLAAASGVVVSAHVERLEPRLRDTLPLRQAERRVSSAGAFGFASYETVVEVDGRQARLGHASIAEGIVRRVAVGH